MKTSSVLCGLLTITSVAMVVIGLSAPGNACSMKPSATRPGKYYNSCTMDYYETVPNSSAYTYGGSPGTRLRPADSGYSDGYSTGDYACNGYSCYAQ